MQQRPRAQATVEAALGVAVLALVLALLLSVAWWGHAQTVLTAAVQDGARAASARGGSLASGLLVARQLLHAGLGENDQLVEVWAQEDAEAVAVVARGRWPLAPGPGVDLGLPLGAEARMRKERWQP